eukprot:TRINITY_DN16110_c0_g1_i1.p1 TRINITY_DN16110_c0_g1~~TRINITY_DN16110_c0_g1_i1.p1  ORF type:complete len:293 (+),score=53.45 TRINITY_DN16110_c0_g1_i1:91-879(+)
MAGMTVFCTVENSGAAPLPVDIGSEATVGDLLQGALQLLQQQQGSAPAASGCSVQLGGTPLELTTALADAGVGNEAVVTIAAAGRPRWVRCHSACEISADETVVEKSGDANAACCIADPPLHPGNACEWSVRLELAGHSTGGFYLTVGVAEPEYNLAKFPQRNYGEGGDGAGRRAWVWHSMGYTMGPIRGDVVVTQLADLDAVNIRVDWTDPEDLTLTFTRAGARAGATVRPDIGAERHPLHLFVCFGAMMKQGSKIHLQDE